MLIDLIAGARPNFMKIAPIIKALNGTLMPQTHWEKARLCLKEISLVYLYIC